ncbi:kinase-like domain-containing protein [Cantharellus anzutake]|uniref:kinase-like domain-containing protein n=1 Tax=Cantharellus anzutake TaxID=1750568 RepID=UPI001902D3DC|nr:kinase-like domain-containing protein [Cantharellus anzutake]KAF8329539.1 kinase-like domain-containing protein [Cantharellus anzutake]
MTRVYAVKKIKKRRSRFGPQQNGHEKELLCHRIASGHRNVLTLHHVIDSGDVLYLVLDYLPEGDLQTSLTEHGSMYRSHPQHIKRIFLQILDAVQHCHDKRVYHRDLKPENVLLKDFGATAVLADFGLSSRKASSVDFEIGSDYYMSPECYGELHCSKPYASVPNDVWSLGVMLFYMVIGSPPWTAARTGCKSFLSFLCDPDFFLRRYPVSAEMNRMLMHVFAIDPTRRMSIDQLRGYVQGISLFTVTESQVRRLRTVMARPPRATV